MGNISETVDISCLRSANHKRGSPHELLNKIVHTWDLEMAEVGLRVNSLTTTLAVITLFGSTGPHGRRRLASPYSAFPHSTPPCSKSVAPHWLNSMWTPSRPNSSDSILSAALGPSLISPMISEPGGKSCSNTGSPAPLIFARTLCRKCHLRSSSVGRRSSSKSWRSRNVPAIPNESGWKQTTL